MVTVIDYGAGNLQSVVNAARFLGVNAVVSGDADEIYRADKIILPGVGAFGESMRRLNDAGISEALKGAAERGAWVLGICLGLQLLFDYSEEFGRHEGLGLVRGGVKKLAAGTLKLPHIAWTGIEVKPSGRLLRGINSGDYFYFVHSFRAQAEDKRDEAASAEYGEKFTAAVEKDNVMATQFHPEKSGASGLRILENFFGL